MKRSVCIKFDRRADGRGIIWAHSSDVRSYPGKLLPGCIVSAKCCGVAVLLEVVKIEYEHNIQAKIVSIENGDEIHDLMRLQLEEQVLKLSRDNIFSCEFPSIAINNKENSSSILLKTQQIRIFEVN